MTVLIIILALFACGGLVWWLRDRKAKRSAAFPQDLYGGYDYIKRLAIWLYTGRWEP